jgi:hypothetical protein
MINEPFPWNKHISPVWYSQKFDGPGVRYEIALAILSGDVAWVNGPFPCGMYNDYTIFEKKGLLDQLGENERVEADDGYSPLDPEFVKCPSGIQHPEEKQAMRRRVMGRQETINKKLKEWGCMNKKFIQPDLSKHLDCFYTVMVIIQIGITQGEKLYEVDEYSDE